MPVALARMVTATVGIAAPLGSRILPVRLALSAHAAAQAARATIKTSGAARTRMRLLQLICIKNNRILFYCSFVKLF
jgi:hypothetical protein